MPYAYLYISVLVLNVHVCRCSKCFFNVVGLYLFKKYILPYKVLGFLLFICRF